MIITTNLPIDNRVSINVDAIEKISSLAEKVLDRVVNDNSEILHAPKSSAAVEAFYSNVDTIMANRLKNRLLK
jgi:hypothetical protein